MLVLAMIYAAMNILSFVALQYIGAGEFSIVAQLKILTTAGFSVAVLRTSLSWTKWRALFQLVFGCILVASPHFSASTVAVASTANANNINSVVGVSEGLPIPIPVPSQTFFKLLGYGAVLSEVVLSGFASIYFERVVKSKCNVVVVVVVVVVCLLTVCF
jgi:solute carrier family 35 (UDP-sugar transporter), member A1/2/3